MNILTKEKDYLRKLLIYIYIHVNTDSNKNIASFRSVRCLSNFNQTSFSSLSLSVHVDKRRKNRSVPYGQRSCTGCCSFIRGDQLARRMADNGSIKKSCYCRVAVENFDVAKQDGKRSRSRTVALLYLKRTISFRTCNLRRFSKITFTNNSMIQR